MAPDHKSLLTEILSRCTELPVQEVKDGVRVESNHIYIVPPAFEMALEDGKLRLTARPFDRPRGQRLPIDSFFTSLAKSEREKAICIVLSGAGSDGTEGAREIHNGGGFVLAQSLETAEYEAMPRSAIEAGIVDAELAPRDMMDTIRAYIANGFGKDAKDLKPMSRLATEAEFDSIFDLLRDRTGHDFSQYKHQTVHRRIERQMAVHHSDTHGDYIKFLSDHPEGIDELFHDLLIGVTSFFRDPEIFKTLADTVVPGIFSDKTPRANIRIWSVGCSTGQEAYSLAILLRERAEALKKNFNIQIFATDLDERAIATARTGLYPLTIAAEVTRERLDRFFSLEPDGSAYRVHKSIREMLIFSIHDVLKDPPFSKMDLICCRNVMIYFNADLQRKVIATFRYALNEKGTLFLGGAEGVGSDTDMFATLDGSARLFRRQDSYRGPSVFSGAHKSPSKPPSVKTPGAAGIVASVRVKLTMRELTERALLRELAPPSALVRGDGALLYLHGRAGMYLEPASGEAAKSNILKMARPGLADAMEALLKKSVSSGEAGRASRVSVKTNGHYTNVDISIRPLKSGDLVEDEAALYLITMNESAQQAESSLGPAGDRPSDSKETVDHKHQVTALKNDIRVKDEFIKKLTEDLDVSEGELKVFSEEMQSVNEEMQSTNEELETSKEELQSVNEELATVNAELQSKVSDLSLANNDMNNLLSGTGIATIFVDRKLRVLRFTPSAREIVNLMTIDLGRPLGDLVTKLENYDTMLKDAEHVLETLTVKELEVRSSAGKWYLMQIRPYRTLNNVVEGAVISFVDVSEVVSARQALKSANEVMRLAVVVRDSSDAITMQDLSGRTLAWNPGAERIYGWTEAEALAINVRDRIPANLRKAEFDKIHRLSHEEVLESYRTQRVNKAGELVHISMICTALVNNAGEIYGFATTERRSEP